MREKKVGDKWHARRGSRKACRDDAAVCGAVQRSCWRVGDNMDWHCIWCNSGYLLIEAVFGAMREDGALCGAGWGARVRGLSLSVSGRGRHCGLFVFFVFAPGARVD